MNNPNILYVTVDSLRKDAVTPETMPYLSRLKEDGIWFENMHATAPATAASFVGLQASRYYSDVDGIGLPDDEFTTLAEAFSGDGYQTLGRSTNKFTSSYYNYDRGFDAFDSPTSGLKFAIRRYLDEESRLFSFLEWGYHHWLEFNAGQGEHQLSWWNTPAEDVNEWALNHLNDAAGSQWFTWLHHMDPHHPLEPPEDYLPDNVPDRGAGQALSRELPGKVPAGRDDDLEKIHGLYQAECRYWDDEFRVFHQSLDNPLVVVVGDHGELLGEHDRFGHPHEMWQELTNIPCVIYHPSLPSKTIDSRQSTIDLPPTLLDLAGIDTPFSMRGEPINIEQPRPREHAVGTIETPEHVGMIRTGNWTWMRHQSRRSTQNDHGEILFPANDEGIAVDGMQTADNHPDVCERLASEFEDVVGSEPAATGHRMQNEQVKQHMADLGYLEQQ